jgi:hypothetical protein
MSKWLSMLGQFIECGVIDRRAVGVGGMDSGVRQSFWWRLDNRKHYRPSSDGRPYVEELGL